MSCNCGKRALGVLGWLGWKQMPSVKVTPPEGVILYIRSAPLIVVSTVFVEEHHFRLTLLALLAKLIFPDSSPKPPPPPPSSESSVNGKAQHLQPGDVQRLR